MSPELRYSVTACYSFLQKLICCLSFTATLLRKKSQIQSQHHLIVATTVVTE